MNYQEWDDLGQKIQEMIDNAVNEQNYQKLSQTITRTVEKTLNLGGDAFRDVLDGNLGGSSRSDRKPGSDYVNPEHNARAYETRRNHGYQQPPFGRQQGFAPAKKQETGIRLYRKPAGEKTKAVLLTVFGGVLTGGMGIGFILTLLALGIGLGTSAQTPLLSGTVLTGIFTAGSAVMLSRGCSRLGRLGRFQKYIRELGERTYCNLDQLSKVTGKPIKFVKKDVRTMIAKGWFPEGHVDKQETCLIVSNETYKQYVNTQLQLEQREKEKPSKAVQDVLDRGNSFISQIRKSNEAIPGEEISEKISRTELIVQKIFDRARLHPEIIPDLNRMMDYYLPMTVKLLKAYADMDAQPIQGDNIMNSKREIEETIDTLNVAFEKILDSVFQDTAMDVSSDISVLQTVLAQEGLAEDELTRMRREAARLDQ